MVGSIRQVRQRRRHRDCHRRHRRAGVALVPAHAGRAGERPLPGGQRRGARAGRGQGEGPGDSDRRSAMPARRTRRGRRCCTRSCCTTRTTRPARSSSCNGWSIMPAKTSSRRSRGSASREALLDEKNYDEALKTIDVKTDDAFVAIYSDLRGDILAVGRQEGRGARRIPGRAGQDGSEVAVPPIRAGQARFAWRRAVTPARASALVIAALLLGGCQTVPESWTSWMPTSLPTPSLTWLGIGKERPRPARCRRIRTSRPRPSSGKSPLVSRAARISRRPCWRT